ncbi:MAG: DUF1572 family protein [Bacteroidetes bacterium]|nr:DUF1572 family protein [Bacteroidota bacterium]MDA1119344.1 DUF1572 family protein [Bacteroidota bacterium]
MKDIFKSLINRDLDKLITEINSYPSDNSLWVIADGISNSGGNLSLHICGNLRHFIGAILGEDGYVRDRDFEFSGKGISKESLVEEIGKTKKSISDALDNISEASLESLYPIQGPIPNATSVVYLTHLYGHLNYHLGQINYHRRLLSN